MLIDVTRLVHRKFRGRLPTGVDRVSLAYLERYGARSAALLRLAGRWLVLRQRESQPVFEALISREPQALRQLVWRLPRALPMRGVPDVRHRALLNTGHSGLEQPRYATEVRRRGLRPLYFVHDLIPITHPEYTRPGEDDRHRRRLQTVLDTGAALVVNSHSTRTQLMDYAHRLGRRLPDCVVAPLAPAALPVPSSLAPMDRPYFVVVGTVEPRKNHLLLLQVWRRLVEELGDAAPRLVVIGQRGWECAPVLAFLQQCTALRDFVIARPHCSDSDLSTWLQHARALLFPSFVEGFGLPLAEALALRVPVIASNLAAFQEVAGDIPELLDPLDGPAWQQAIRDYMQPDGLRPELQRQRMSGYSAPTWGAHFAVVDALVDSCLRPSGLPAPQAGWIHAARG
jgi:glycosyltransferase involved in cell wall biosynthesis